MYLIFFSLMGIVSLFYTLRSHLFGRAAAAPAVKSWSNLPDSITSLIMDHLYYSDQIRFRAVCKSWRSNNVFAVKYADTLPWVFAYSREEDSGKENSYNIYSSSCFLFEPSAKRRYAIELPAVLVKAKILYSKYGWILLSKSLTRFDSLFFFLYCPFTDKIIELPRLKKEKISWDDERILFSASPNSSTDECVIYLVRCSVRMETVCISTCCPSDKTWVSRKFKCSYGEIHGLAYFKGFLYCAVSEKLLVFNPATKKLMIYPLNMILPPIVKGVTANRLIESESDEKLLILYSDSDRHYIRVFELDSLEMKWFEIERLVDKLLFVGYTDSISVPAIGEASGLANTLYFKSGESFISYFPSRPELLHACIAQRHYGWIEKPWWRDNNFEVLKTVWIRPPSLG